MASNITPKNYKSNYLNPNFLKIIFMKKLNLFFIFIIGLFVIIGITTNLYSNDALEPEVIQEIHANIDLHPWLSGFDQTPFGKKAAIKLSKDEYRQVLSELSYILRFGAMPEYKFRILINNSGDRWFDLGDNASYYISNDELESRKVIKQGMKNAWEINAKNALYNINIYIQ